MIKKEVQTTSRNPMHERGVTIEEIRDPSLEEARRVHREQADRNWKWLATDGQEMLHQASGRFLAVAGQEGRVCDTLDEALA
jgi:hypothetical protein